MKFNILISLFCLFSSQCWGATFHAEKEYQTSWCNKYHGKMEHVLPDKARVDCLTETHAIEFDFANKWAESIGQSLYYGLVTNKKPGVVLIVENPKKDSRYVKRLKQVANERDIDFWLMYRDEVHQ